MVGSEERVARTVRAGLAAFLLALSPGCGATKAPAPDTAPAVEVIPLWPSAPPGTKSWSGEEVALDAALPGSGKVHIVTNVTAPTLTVFRPEPGQASGAAAIVLPGGAFRALAWDLEGTEVAQWLARRGITAFVLKYRVRPPAEGSAPGAESFDAFYDRTRPARQVAAADAGRALRLVRAEARSFGLDPARVGMVGFSAGAMTAMETALATEPALRPDFAVIAYGAMPASASPPPGAPPLFVVAARDDPQVPPAKSVAIQQAWNSARLPVELHLYEQGGHGFGMRPRHLAADAWPLALDAWLRARGLVATAPAKSGSR